MKRVIGLVFICGTASCVAASAASDASVHHGVAAASSAKAVAAKQSAVALLAPADEYFGPLKMSILGIRNTIRDLGARYDVNHDIGHQTFSSAQLTERAIHDWEHRYPLDRQVPKAIYLLQRLYTKILTQESRDRAGATAKWIFADYASSPQSKVLKKILAVEHLEPVISPNGATPVPVPAYPSTFGSPYPSIFSSGSAAPIGTPTPSPAPAPTGMAPPDPSTPVMPVPAPQ